jgi:hypothetical protein
VALSGFLVRQGAEHLCWRKPDRNTRVLYSSLSRNSTAAAPPVVTARAGHHGARKEHRHGRPFRALKPPLDLSPLTTPRGGGSGQCGSWTSRECNRWRSPPVAATPSADAGEGARQEFVANSLPIHVRSVAAGGLERVASAPLEHHAGREVSQAFFRAEMWGSSRRPQTERGWALGQAGQALSPCVSKEGDVEINAVIGRLMQKTMATVPHAVPIDLAAPKTAASTIAQCTRYRRAQQR